jgi:hypothetical protein
MGYWRAIKKIIGISFLKGAEINICQKSKMATTGTGNKGLCRAKHDTTTACQQGKVEQVYIKRNFGHCILLDTVNSSTQ